MMAKVNKLCSQPKWAAQRRLYGKLWWMQPQHLTWMTGGWTAPALCWHLLCLAIRLTPNSLRMTTTTTMMMRRRRMKKRRRRRKEESTCLQDEVITVFVIVGTVRKWDQGVILIRQNLSQWVIMEQLKIKEGILVMVHQDITAPGSSTTSRGVSRSIGDCRVEVTVQLEQSTTAKIQAPNRQFVAMKMGSHTWTSAVQVQGM
jgi:hypothetical protein